MPFDIRQLRYAIAAADHGSFYRAARRLDVEQSTLSRAILKLERSIGMPIFERSRAGVTMTLAGNAFIRGAKGKRRPPHSGSATINNAIGLGERQRAASARSPQQRKAANPHERIWPLAREREPATLIVTGTDETLQGLGRSAAKIERRSQREAPTPFAQLAFPSYFDYILIGLIAGDKHGYRDESVDRACPPGTRGEG